MLSEKKKNQQIIEEGTVINDRCPDHSCQPNTSEDDCNVHIGTCTLGGSEMPCVAFEDPNISFDIPEYDDEEVIADREEQLSQALIRLQYFVHNKGLRPEVLDHWRNGTLCYSYRIPNSSTMTISPISANPRYSQIVQELEEEYNSVIYYVMENRNILSMLYVSKYKSDWWGELPVYDNIIAFGHRLDYDIFECGTITVSIHDDVLIRTH